MKIHARSAVCLILACTTLASASEKLLQFAHEIFFPGVNGEFKSTSSVDNHRPVQINAGFHINPPPPPPHFRFPFPLLPLPPSFSNRNRIPSIKSVNKLEPQPPRENLFTPNTKPRRPESQGQYESYLKALEEEDKDANLGGNTENVESLASTPVYEELATDGPRSRAYVNLNVQGKEYAYAT